MKLVVDTGVAIAACGSSTAREQLLRHDLAAPPLLWSELHSAVTEARWRKQLEAARAAELLTSFAELPIARLMPEELYTAAVAVAGELGWAKTYDAEFVALARLTESRVVTTDGRLLRGAARTGLVIGVIDL